MIYHAWHSGIRLQLPPEPQNLHIDASVEYVRTDGCFKAMRASQRAHGSAEKRCQ
jgi:hypothetical protein